MDSGKLNETEKVPLIHRLLNHRYAASVPMPEKDVISEAMGHMFVLLFILTYAVY